MDTLKAIAGRKSTRSFDTEKPVSRADLDTIVAAGCAAPVGGADYASLHLTVLTNHAATEPIVQAARQAMHMESSPLYGATAFVVVCAGPEQKFPNIELANTGCIMENMMVAAADLGVDSVYIWGAIAATAADTALWSKLGVPEGFRPVSGVALGYGKEGGAAEKKLTISLATNYVE